MKEQGFAGLEGRVAIVTGGSKGIGRAIVLELAQRGADVAIVTRSDLEAAEDVAARVRDLGRRAFVVPADIADEAAVRRMVDTAADHFGQLDILVNNAGHMVRAPLIDLATRDWDAVFAVNARGCFLCGTAIARYLIAQGAGGSLVNIIGASAHRAFPDNGGYAPSKAAVVNLTRQMALEWAPAGIRVNGVSPGPIFESDSDWETTRPDLKTRFARLPLQRPGTPQDVARAVAFLVSDDAQTITGHVIPVDSGSTLTWYLTP